MPDRSYHILLVDDEPAILRALTRQLATPNFKVSTAGNAQDALTSLETAEPPVDMVMSDVRMPGMSGVDLVAEVKNRWPDTVRILNTGFADRQVAMDAVNKGEVFRIISKPWQPGEVAAVVADAFRHFEPIWERRRLEQALAEIRHQATGENGPSADLARNLLIPNLEMARVERLKNHFVAVAAHELKTPLTTLKLYADGLVAGEWDADPQQRHKAHLMVGKGVDRLVRIVNDLVTVLQQQEDVPVGGSAASDLAYAGVEALDEVRGWCEGRRAQTFSSDCGQAVVDLASVHSRLVTRNLLINAVRHTPDGGEVRMETCVEGPEGVLRVIDTGDGVPAEEKERIFERFYHAGSYEHHSSGDVEYGSRGLGLGLWLVQRMVAQAGGRVYVEDRPGGGSVFVVRLPKVDPAPTGDPL